MIVTLCKMTRFVSHMSGQGIVAFMVMLTYINSEVPTATLQGLIVETQCKRASVGVSALSRLEMGVCADPK